eukprot:GHVS01100080.1.p1 GENE.GHVS01100080.1~~GHVS01100080.1.p1  ORF type:complete len:239 (-),score=24.98 GHVS01100080.1:124-840(-)
MTSMLIGENPSLADFGVSFAKHLVDNDSTFSNPSNENDWLAKGSLKLSYGEDKKLYACHTGHKEFAGWLPVTYGVVQENGDRPHITVRIDSKNGRYDITFERREIVNEWDFVAMFDGIACNRKRTAEALFEGPWESIEKFLKGGVLMNEPVIFIAPSATASIKGPVSAKLLEIAFETESINRQKIYYDTKAIGFLDLVDKKEELKFRLTSKTNDECFHLFCRADDTFGWKCPKWEKCN